MSEPVAERWVPGDGPVQVLRLASGLVNESYRVTRNGRVYSLRIAAAAGHDLGLDRRWECAVRERAGAAGLAPALCRCDAERGILVAAWATGRAWSAEQAALPASIDAMALLLRRVHALEIPQPARRMDPGAWIAHYRAALARREAAGMVRSGPLRSQQLRGASDACLATLATHPASAAVLCHSDLHRLNLLIGDRPVLLDWEYAHVSDGFWDVAGWVANNDWNELQATRLLAGYLQQPPRATDLARLQTWVWLFDYVCLLWCELFSSHRCGVQGLEIAARGQLIADRLAQRADWSGGGDSERGGGGGGAR